MLAETIDVFKKIKCSFLGNLPSTALCQIDFEFLHPNIKNSLARKWNDVFRKALQYKEKIVFLFESF